MITSTCTGKVLEARTATFFDEQNQQQTYGKIQLLVKDMSGDFYAIQNIKVKIENFGWIPDIAQLKGKEVTLSLSQNSYNGKVSYYLSEPLKSKSAA